MTLLTLSDVRVQHGNRAILSLDRMTFAAGRIYAVVGPSGAGKTTLLRVINFLDRPSTGTMQFAQTRLDLVSPTPPLRLALQRQMGYVAQRPVMFHASVYDNVAMGLRYRGVGSSQIESRVTDALERVGMREFAREPAAQLSGGEAQRIALARAIVLQPALLLLDEPTANLDPYHVAVIENVIKELHDEHQTTIIIVTHHLQQARRLSTDTLFLHQGQVVETAATDDLFTSPCRQETRDFLSGRMVY